MNIAIPDNALGAHSHSAPHQRRVPESLEALGITKQYRRDQEICSQMRPSKSWYRVTGGAARKFVLLSSGRRQILDLVLVGDFFDDYEQEEHDFAVEAVTEGTTVARYPHQRVEDLAGADPELACEIRRIGSEIRSRLEELVLILGRTTALEKVGCFLLLMSERPAVRQGDGVALPISRYDIADYLGLSVETVSRSLTDLKHRGLITLAGTRRITIINRTAIAEGDYPAARHGTGRIPSLSVPCHFSKSS
jgi:CRP-like cAMP-binding protein